MNDTIERQESARKQRDVFEHLMSDTSKPLLHRLALYRAWLRVSFLSEPVRVFDQTFPEVK